MQCFVDDFDACIAHLRFPLRHRKVIRTTSLHERLFLEERRRTKMVPHAFGERPVLKLMYAAVIPAADRWRGITAGEFEQRQLRAIRTELDRAHADPADLGLDRRRVGGDRTIPQFGDTGREPDASDLIYYRARYYDPNTGRFAQRDPIGISGGLNLYAYANSNLVNLKGIEPLRYYQTAGG